MKNNPNETSVAYKVLNICFAVLNVAVMALAWVQLLGIWDKAINLFCPLMMISIAGQACLQWNRNRKIAYFHIITAVIMLIFAIVVFFVK